MHERPAIRPAGATPTRRLGLALLLCLLLPALACSTTRGSNSSRPTGPDTTDFPLEVLGGGEISEASLRDRDVVLWFWAPWCTVCRAEAPGVRAVGLDYESRVELVGVAGRGEPSSMEDFVSDTGMERFRHVVDGDGSVWSAYGVAQQPAFAFLDDTGSVEVVQGTLPAEELATRLSAMAES